MFTSLIRFRFQNRAWQKELLEITFIVPLKGVFVKIKGGITYEGK